MRYDFKGKGYQICGYAHVITNIVQQKLILRQWQIMTRNQFESGAMDGRLLDSERAIVISALSSQPASTLELARCKEKGATFSIVYEVRLIGIDFWWRYFQNIVWQCQRSCKGSLELNPQNFPNLFCIQTKTSFLFTYVVHACAVV